MYQSVWQMQGFDSLAPTVKCRIVLEMVRALTLIDMAELPHLNPGPLYQTGIRYAFQSAEDDWQDAARMLATGGASCNSLAAWRCAELRLAGYDARPYVKTQMGQPQEDGSMLDVFHVIVRVTDEHGQQWTEDPSVLLGMPDPNSNGGWIPV
jgi:hypothetical protein